MKRTSQSMVKVSGFKLLEIGATVVVWAAFLFLLKSAVQRAPVDQTASVSTPPVLDTTY
ncbi:hypothetical protein ACQ4M4_27465 [Leptolyngbya sp. AN02str]|uniref:hypothetical protein n=1 Tax=Leptolyngbya sp. AN02str TaxID=3423363 RepID=UPI003D31A623